MVAAGFTRTCSPCGTIGSQEYPLLTGDLEFDTSALSQSNDTDDNDPAIPGDAGLGGYQRLWNENQGIRHIYKCCTKSISNKLAGH